MLFEKNNKSGLFKALVVSGFLLVTTTFNSYAGHRNYFIKTTIDYSGFGIMSEVLTDDATGKNTGTGGDDSEYMEEKNGYNYSKVKHFGNICKNTQYTDSNTNYLTINFMSNRDDEIKRKEQYKELEGMSNDALVFSFPGLKGEMNGGYSATSNDYTRASVVAETLTTSLNQALLFIRNNASQNIVNNHSLHLALAKMSYTSELDRVGSYVIKIGGNGNSTQYKLSKADSSSSKVVKELIPVNGLNYSDYVKIEVLDGDNQGNYSYFPYRMAKGYYPNQPLHEYVTSKYRDNVQGNENEYLAWGHLILQAMLNRDTQGTAEQDYASDIQTIIGQGLGSDLSRTISSVRNGLGLSSMSELVLNMGARPANYHMGVMAYTMRNISMTVYIVNLIISLLALGFMIIRLIHQKMLATTNIIAKTSLMEGLKDIIVVAVMLGFFAPLFEVLLELNYLIVRTFSYSSEYMNSFSILGGKALAMESMAGFIMSSMFLSIDMYINFVYVVRELVVSFLYAIAPIMIVSYLWSPNQKNMVFSYYRELIGNVFMQSFHAITMTFFSGYNVTNMSTLQALASAYCFIPITQLFRQLVIGNQGGFSEKLGGKLAGQVATSMTGMQKAGMQYKQSKEMLETQQKANMTQSVWSVGGAGAGAIAGAGIGTMIAGPLGTVVGGAIGGIISGATSAIGTMEAQKEIGKTQLKHSEQQMGMGLAELGIGMGISSFDSAGDRMVQTGLAGVQEGAKNRGQADARYNPNNLGGYGTASYYAGGAVGVEAFGKEAVGSIKEANREHKKNLKPPVKTYGDITEMSALPGLNCVQANHVHDVRNFNHTKGEFEMITNIKTNDLKNKEHADLSNIYNAYKNRNASNADKAKWQSISNETGIKEIAEGLGGRLEFLMDVKRSGFIGEMSTHVDTSGIERKFFKLDLEQSRKKVD